jgi:hypothetical protein
VAGADGRLVVFDSLAANDEFSRGRASRGPATLRPLIICCRSFRLQAFFEQGRC